MVFPVAPDGPGCSRWPLTAPGGARQQRSSCTVHLRQHNQSTPLMPSTHDMITTAQSFRPFLSSSLHSTPISLHLNSTFYFHPFKSIILQTLLSIHLPTSITHIKPPPPLSSSTGPATTQERGHDTYVSGATTVWHVIFLPPPDGLLTSSHTCMTGQSPAPT